MSSQCDVLVVEDEPRLRSFLERALTEMDLRCLCVSGAAPAREVMRRAAPATLLLDVRLGAEDGLAMLESLRDQGFALPAVVMTAYADVPLAQRALRLGAVDLLTKPFSLAELEAALSRARNQQLLARAAPGTAADEPRRDSPAETPTFDQVKRQALEAALARSGGNRTLAAKALGVSRRTLYNWLARLDA